uniref:DEUBAD domain-containing protein n=1 Tax=Triticum urartu TaxID=4572 RepID=A0A8R7V674_TRIUA
MGIVKVASGAPIAKSSYSRENEDLTQEERLLLESFPSHDSADDCEHAEVDCELAMSGGQLCNVPYGLYDLPELNDILSLETWNSCLTEEDRFRLAAYLPDMDQHDLFTTMTELLSGSAMFFGSPLRGFFDRLNGGFYSPEVSRARELLMNFQRRRYYHFLKLYHDGIVWKFACMDKLWRRSLVDTSLEEKIHIWHNWIQEKLLTFADPNSSPLNARLSNIGEVEAASFASLKRAKLIEGTSSTNWSAKYKEIVHEAKPVEISSSNSHIFHLQDVPGEKCSKPPKVVLKANADSDFLADGNAGICHTPGLIPLAQLGVQAVQAQKPGSWRVH